MVAVQRNLAMEQGADFLFPFQWCARNEDGSAGDPVNLAGWSARMQIRTDFGGAIWVDATTTNNKIKLGIDPNTPDVTDPTNGFITIKLTADDTDAINVKRAKYDLELVNPQGGVTRLPPGFSGDQPERDEGRLMSTVVQFFDDEGVVAVEDVETDDGFVLVLPDEPSGVTVPLGVFGPTSSGGGVFYTHHQSSPSASWLVNHNLGHYISPQIFLDDDPTRAVNTDMVFADPNTITLIFPSPVTGRAEFNG